MTKVPSPGKIWWGFTILRQRLLLRDPITGSRIRPGPARTVGTGHGKFVVPNRTLGVRGGLVYSVGVGEETSFDEALVREHGMTVHAFDPTPRAIAHATRLAASLPGFHFHPEGLWNEDTTLVFHAPENPLHVSHSVTALQGDRPGFTAACRRLTTLMRTLGHDRLELLKLNIEGAEYAVLRDLLKNPVPVGALVVVFDESHSPQDGGWRDRIAAMVAELAAGGYQLVAVRPKGNYTFLGPARAGG